MQYNLAPVERLYTVMFRPEATDAVVLLGAGASIDSHIPGSAALVERAARWGYARESGLAEDDSHVVQGWHAWLEAQQWYQDAKSLADNYPQVFDHVLRPREDRKAFLRSLLDAPDVRPSQGYELLASRIGTEAIRTILTTNFDRLVGDSCRLHDPPIHVQIIEAPDDLVQFAGPPRPRLVYLHGSVDHYTDQNLDDEVQRLDERLVQEVSMLLRDHPLVVIGYRGAEPSIMRHLLIEQAAKTGNFRSGVYWCARRDSIQSGLGPLVDELAQAIDGNFFVVQIEGYDQLMQRLADLDRRRALPTGGLATGPSAAASGGAPVSVSAPGVRFDAALAAGALQAAPVPTGPQATYLPPRLMWRRDVGSDPVLGDPDALEAWLEMGLKTEVVSVEDALRHKRVLVLAEFNMGKTRLLEYMCQVVRTTVPAPVDVPIATPAFVRVRDYHNADEPFINYIQRAFADTSPHSGTKTQTEHLPTPEVLREGLYTFLFDGLDELDAAQRKQLLQRIRDFVREYPQHAYIVTSRPGADLVDTLITDLDFEPLTIAPFSKGQIREYLKRRGLQGADVEQRILQRRDLLAVGRVPGMLAILADLADAHLLRGELPRRTSAIYTALIDATLRRERARGTDVVRHLGLTRGMLDALALTMMRVPTYSISREELERVVDALTRHRPPTGYTTREWVDELMYRQLLVPQSSDVAFHHRSWQEYLAASAIASASVPAILADTYVEDAVAQGFNPIWYPVLRFLVELRSEVGTERGLLDAMFRRDRVTAARCTPSDADEQLRRRAFRTLFEAAASARCPLPGAYNTPRDFYNDRLTCVDLAPGDAVDYLLGHYRTSTEPIVRENAFELLIDLAVGGSLAARDAVRALLPELLRGSEPYPGLRESAAYAVSQLDLPTFSAPLRTLYADEADQSVRKAVLWSLAKIDPSSSTEIFLPLLKGRLTAQLPDATSELALQKALPQLIRNDEFVSALRIYLESEPSPSLSLPEGLIEQLARRNSLATRELLLVIAIHKLSSYALTGEGRKRIYEVLRADRLSAARYVLLHIGQSYAGVVELADTLAALLDEATFDALEPRLREPDVPQWARTWTARMLERDGQLTLAKRLAPEYFAQPAPPPSQAASPPPQRTLAGLLEEPGWETGSAFGPNGGVYAPQVSELDPSKREELIAYVEKILDEFDPDTAVRQIDERRFQYDPKVTASLSYAAELELPVTPELFGKLLALNIETEALTELCERGFDADEAETVLSYVRADAPATAMKRAAALCGERRVLPERAVPRIAETLLVLCSSGDPGDAGRDILVDRLIDARVAYGHRGVSALDDLLLRVSETWRPVLAQTRLSLMPPNSAAERIYLERLLGEVRSRSTGLMRDEGVANIRTPQAVPLLFEVLKALLPVGLPAHVQVPGAVPFELEASLMRARTVAALTRLSSDEVLRGYGALLREFPDHTWLHTHYDDARRVYLAQGRRARPEGLLRVAVHVTTWIRRVLRSLGPWVQV